MEYVRLGTRDCRFAHLPRLHELRRARPAAHMRMDAERGRQPALHQAGARAGINFFDTANVYSRRRQRTKSSAARSTTSRTRDEGRDRHQGLHGRCATDPNGRGLSRKAILSEIDDSLKRLGTDYVDLYQIHRLDYDTPIEETLEALNDVVRAGKARYIGASSM